MKRLFIAYAFALVGVLFPVLPAQAGAPIYAGNLQVTSNANLTFLNGASGCLIAQNGIVAPLPCPVGTVAFQAAAPFTVTGAGPYVIGCPTCLTTAGGTILGAVTISNTLTLNGATNASSPISISGIGAVQLGGGGQYAVHNANSPLAVQFPNNSSTTGNTFLGSNSLATVQTFPCNVLALGNFGFSPDICIDNAGHIATADTIYAAAFQIVSKRAYKYDIHPLSFDALQVLHDADFAAFRYKAGHGDPRLPHIGIIADDSPSVLSGQKHDHLDLEALATVDAKAILQLDTQIKILYLCVGALAFICVLLAAGLGLVWREKAG